MILPLFSDTISEDATAIGASWIMYGMFLMDIYIVPPILLMGLKLTICFPYKCILGKLIREPIYNHQLFIESEGKT